MSAQPALRLVDRATGEILPHCERCQGLQDELDGLIRKMRGLAREVRELERDKEAEAQAHKLWPVVVALHGEWKVLCRHPKAGWNSDLFWPVAVILKVHPVIVCQRAIAGAHHDPFTTKRRNGSICRHDAFSLIFRSVEKVEDFANRAPKNWRPLHEIALPR